MPSPDVVLILQHEPGEGPGNLLPALEAAGLRAQVLQVGERGSGAAVPPAMGTARALVVLGGGASVTELASGHPSLRDEVRLLEEAVRAGLPVLGICLGSQLLAAALHGSVHRAARPEIGFAEVALDPAAAGDPLLRDLGPAFLTLHWHGDAFGLPPGATLLAHTGLTPVQAFRFGAQAWGLQFHPEVTADTLAAMVGSAHDELRSAGIEPAALLAQGAKHLASCARTASVLFGRFAALVAGQRASASGAPAR